MGEAGLEQCPKQKEDQDKDLNALASGQEPGRESQTGAKSYRVLVVLAKESLSFLPKNDETASEVFEQRKA